MTLRVLIITPSMHPSYGGPPRVVVGSAVALKQAGVEIQVATMGATREETETRSAWPELPAAAIPLHIFPSSGPAVLGRSDALRDFIRSRAGDFDLLHIHCIWENVLAVAAREFCLQGRPYVVSAHGMLDHWQLAKSRFKKFVSRRFFGTDAMLRRASTILYGTQEEADEASCLHIAPPTIMPNGVEPPVVSDVEAARAYLEDLFPVIQSWTRTILFFSRMHPKKGLDLLVEAFGRIHREFPTAGLFAAAIAQDEQYEREVRAKVAAFPGANIVVTTDLVGPKAKSVFFVADVFALPSHQEGFSIAIVEAASAGLPVLITDACHMSNIAEVGAGIVVPVSVDGLEAGLRQVLSLDEPALRAMGRNGVRLIEENYTWGRVADRLVVTYSRAVANRATI